MHLTTENPTAGAAERTEHLRGIAAGAERTECARRRLESVEPAILTVESTTTLNSAANLLILDIIWIHANRCFNHLGGENTVAETIVCQCAQIIPLCRAIRLIHAIEHIGRILIGAKIDEVAGSLKLRWPGLRTCALLILVILITAKAKIAEEILIGIPAAFITASAGVATIVTTIVTAIGALGGIFLRFLRIFDLLIGRVDLIHFLCCHRIIGMHIRMILLCQTAVSPFDLVVGRVPRHA